MPDHHTDEEFLRQALELARRGIGLTSPNPNVGAVIVAENGEVVGILSTRQLKAQGAVFAVTTRHIFKALDELKGYCLAHHFQGENATRFSLRRARKIVRRSGAHYATPQECRERFDQAFLRRKRRELAAKGVEGILQLALMLAEITLITLPRQRRL